MSGCRVNDNDVQRWGSTEHGPDKLEAVLLHEKYEWPLRVEAGMELIRMKPRNGRRIGIGRLTEALALLSPDERKKLTDGVVPAVVAEMKKPVSAPQPGSRLLSIPSYPYKNAAFAMLSYDKAVLIADDRTRKTVTDALVEWSLQDFDHRLDNTAQMFGMEQVMRAIGAPAVKGLPALVTLDPRARPHPRLRVRRRPPVSDSALAAVDRILNRGGDADDVLRAVVASLVERGGCAWAGILFAENGELILGPEAGEPDPDAAGARRSSTRAARWPSSSPTAATTTPSSTASRC